MIVFSENQVAQLATFVAQLVREGVTYKVGALPEGGWAVTLTGGF